MMQQQSEQTKKDPDRVQCLSFKQFYHLSGCFNLSMNLVGIFFIAGGLFILINSLFCPIAYFNLICGKQSWGYVGAALILAGSTFYMIGRHKRRTDLKTAEYEEDVESLVTEIEKEIYGETGTDSDLETPISNEIARLRKHNRDKEREVSCLETMPLRKMQVDLYKNDDVKARVMYDLLELKNMEGYDDYYKSFKEQIKKAENNNDIVQFRVILKNIREALQWATFLSGRGEAILESVSHWSMYAIPSLLLLGILPLLYHPFLKTEISLSVLNWAFLGATGAVLYTVNQMKAINTTRIGEDEGNLVLRTMLLGIIVGVMTAILLYGALKGGIFNGPIFPDMTLERANDIVKNTKNNALSIFWGIFSGFSVKLLGRLMGAAERATSMSDIQDGG